MSLFISLVFNLYIEHVKSNKRSKIIKVYLNAKENEKGFEIRFKIQ